MKVLVTGANGQLGKSLRRVSATGRDEYVFTDVSELDITDSAAVRATVEAIRPKVIVNCAAYTNVDAAEDNPEKAYLLNAEAPAILARSATDVDATLIHVSTDYVFGGNCVNTPITEDYPTNPTGVYGKTKFQGEQLVLQSGCRAVILRTAWLYSPFGKNFVKTMLHLLATRSDIKVVYDQVGTPTNALDLASAIFDIIERRHYEGNEGIYHYTGEGVCSWYDFAVAIAELSGLDDCRVAPCRSSEFPSKVVRPAYSVLDKSKFYSTFGIALPYWRDTLRRTLPEIINSGE